MPALGSDNLVVLQVNGEVRSFNTEKPNEITLVANPVQNPPFNNWSTNQPSPAHDHGMAGHEDLGLKDMVIDGVNGYDIAQKN